MICIQRGSLPIHPIHLSDQTAQLNSSTMWIKTPRMRRDTHVTDNQAPLPHISITQRKTDQCRSA